MICGHWGCFSAQVLKIPLSSYVVASILVLKLGIVHQMQFLLCLCFMQHMDGESRIYYTFSQRNRLGMVPIHVSLRQSEIVTYNAKFCPQATEVEFGYSHPVL